MPWVSQVPAIVHNVYAGMEGGHAIADVLLGDINPSGKLPITFPRVLEDSRPMRKERLRPHICAYKEGILVGYRWFDTKRIEPLFPSDTD